MIVYKCKQCSFVCKAPYNRATQAEEEWRHHEDQAGHHELDLDDGMKVDPASKMTIPQI